MSSRISTSMMFNQSVSLMMAKQAKLSHLEQQIATGSRSSAPRTIRWLPAQRSASTAAWPLDRMKLNAGNVQNRLGVRENTLAQVNELMARVNDLTIQASNPALSAADKKTLITGSARSAMACCHWPTLMMAPAATCLVAPTTVTRRLPRSTARWSTVATRPSARSKSVRTPT